MRRIFTVMMGLAAAHATAAYFFRQGRNRYAAGRKHLMVVQGGAELRPGGDEIADAVISVMMGGLVLDLRQAQLTRRPALLDVLSIMGGVQILVPPDWKVQIDVEPTMGGVRDARTGRIDAERPPDLLVSGRIVMSGLDISSEMPGTWGRRAPPVGVRS